MAKIRKGKPGKCEGWRRIGGAFTLGPVKWVKCEKDGVVMLTLTQPKEGSNQRETVMMSACNECWEECRNTGYMTIKKVVPIAAMSERIDTAAIRERWDDVPSGEGIVRDGSGTHHATDVISLLCDAHDAMEAENAAQKALLGELREGLCLATLWLDDVCTPTSDMATKEGMSVRKTLNELIEKARTAPNGTQKPLLSVDEVLHHYHTWTASPASDHQDFDFYLVRVTAPKGEPPSDERKD